MLGMWMWPESILLRGAQDVVKRCRRAGVTDLFFLTKGLAGLAGFESSFAPRMCDRDLLQELLDAAHQQGVRVHAWFTSACDEHYKHLHPESGRCHFVRGKDRELISLADEGYLHYLEKIVCELCRKYEVDGLHLDYIRYNHLLYGWAEEDLARYAAAGADTEQLVRMMQRMFYGSPPDEELLFDAWRNGDASALALAHVRRRDVVRFAKTLVEAARAERTGLMMSAALMPEGAYEDHAFSDLHYGQHYGDMAQLFDYALPMAYSQAYGKDSQWVKQVAEGTLKSGMKTLVGLHAYEGGTGLTLQRDIAALRNVPAEGYCLFREGASAMAFSNEGQLTVFNPLNETLTHVIVSADGREKQLKCAVAPGTEAILQTGLFPEALRVFANEKECCVYLTKER